MSELVDLYLRKSNRDGGLSVSRQEADLVAEAANAGLTVGRVFIDPDLSASRFARKDRPDYAALLDHIRSGQCQIIGIVETSRGSRDVGEWAGFLKLCRTHGVRIWVQTHHQTYDMSVRRHWRTLMDEGVDNADESEKISERTRSGKRLAASKGLPPGRNVYGHLRVYEATPRGPKIKEVVAHPEQAPIVREMVDRVVRGDSLTAIAADLNARGVPSPAGVDWVGVTVRQTVLRPNHVGKMHNNGQIVAGCWAPIVDETQWNRACAILTRPGRRTQRGTALAHWLSGAVLCGACRKEHLRPVVRRNRYTCYGCWAVSVSLPTLEEVVDAAVLARLARDDADAIFAAQPDSDAYRRAEQELAKLRDEWDENEHAYRTNLISARLAGAREQELAPKIERAEAEVRRLSLPSALEAFRDIDIADAWVTGRLSPAEKRAIARALVDLVVLPTTRRGPRSFDIDRLDESHWAGDPLSWGQHRTA